VSFNSPEFLFFLPSVLVIYGLLFRRDLLRTTFLLCASYMFYMSWNWRYAGLIAASTMVDYYVGLRLSGEERQARRRLLLIASLCCNLGLLGYFKYNNFFVDLITPLFGVDMSFLKHSFLLPVGISFYTFQTLSYTIDVYRRHIEHEPNLIRFATYVAFFPQLVAGPIVRARDFLPQMRRTPDVSRENVQRGLYLVFQGLAKKVLLADLLAGLAVDAVFSDPSGFSSWDLLMGLYAYAFQIYNDFSGYSDVAIGAALMLGFYLPQNFNRPYLAQNPREFWTRWHISLSTWLRDYLYIPLGGNRGTRARVAFSLMMTMLLGGLWHGAALNFVFWGAYHGVLLVLYRGASKHGADALPARILNRIVCFHLVLVGWLLFRGGDMQTIQAYVTGLSHLTLGTRLHPMFYGVLGLAFFTHVFPKAWVTRAADLFAGTPAALQGAVYAGLLVLFMGATLESPAFIYFQF